MRPQALKYWIVVFAVAIFIGCSRQDDYELVDVSALDSTIVIDLKYATDDNFVGKKLYQTNRALLRRGTAERLLRVQKRLRQQGYGLKIWDAYRPLSVQREMWKIVPDSRYVADPAKGSRHNRGAAVDVTLVDLQGRDLPMPTGFDDFSEKAAAHYDAPGREVKKNRAILQKAMTAEGFMILNSEWWHFDDPNWKDCPVLDVPLSEIDAKKK